MRIFFVNAQQKVALIIGAGDAIGSAIMRKFAEIGLIACGARRQGDKLNPLIDELTRKGYQAHQFSCDARREDAVEELFRYIETHIGDVEVQLTITIDVGFADAHGLAIFAECRLSQSEMAAPIVYV